MRREGDDRIGCEEAAIVSSSERPWHPDVVEEASAARQPFELRLHVGKLTLVWPACSGGYRPIL